VSFVLKPAELLYRCVNRLRRFLYRHGILRARRLPRALISIGNRAVGGAGKTPAVIAVAGRLSEEGFRVAVLSRGYRRKSRSGWALVDAPDPVRFGDEPALIRRSVPGADVVVGRDRFSAATRYLESRDCDVFLLDDGFQHLQLERQLDIVIESQARWYREGETSLRDADIILLRDQVSSRSTAGPQYRMKLVPKHFLAATGPIPLEQLRGRRVFAFAGLADNEQFFATLRGLGLTVAGSASFPDHHHYSSADLTAIRRQAAAAGAERIVTTEKDEVKLDATDVVALQVTAEIEGADAFFAGVVDRIRAAQETEVFP
jgi:tetraacyldisaccharide 4'-kinase